MTALRNVVALVGDYRFTATIAVVVLTAFILRFFEAEFEPIAAILLIGVVTAIYEHDQPRKQDKRGSKLRPK